MLEIQPVGDADYNVEYTSCQHIADMVFSRLRPNQPALLQIRAGLLHVIDGALRLDPAH